MADNQEKQTKNPNNREAKKAINAILDTEVKSCFIIIKKDKNGLAVETTKQTKEVL